MDMSELVTRMGAVVFERAPDGRFLVRGGVPGWCRRLRPQVPWDRPVALEEVFPFLSVFLPEAERVWKDGGGKPARTDSGLWAESCSPNGDGDEVHLSATALRLSGASALLVTRSERRFHEEQALLQRGRELKLTHDALMRELEQRDILAHAIVHDLAAPLHTIVGVLSLLAERDLEEEREAEAGWVELATKAANRQRELIGEILDIFVAEGGALQTESAERVEVSRALQQVVAERAPIARSRRLGIDLDPGPPRWVVGDERRLFRVLANLLDNALRYTPEGGTVRIAASSDPETVTVAVEDEGPGVSPDVLPRLFEKFGRSRDARSRTGLGLFFCRITVESWGGSIGYEQRREHDGGARFWIRLKLAPRTASEAEDTALRRSETIDGEAALAR